MPSSIELTDRDRANAFLGLVLASDGLVRALNRSLQDEHGLSLHEFEVLLFLAAFSEDQTMQMTELRRRTPLSQSRVSRVVSGLEKEGLVTRTSDPADSRAVLVSITQNGIDAFNAANTLHQQDLHDHLFSALTDEEVMQLGSITAKVRSAGNPGSTP
ncbi:MAG: MarR family winged helix-turn-helix transcriptional regulator [Acidimicrobiales bacterium]